MQTSYTGEGNNEYAYWGDKIGKFLPSVSYLYLSWVEHENSNVNVLSTKVEIFCLDLENT